MLSDRRQRVLSALIREYIDYALPVASRTLTERYSLGVSSATVRNDLSALEDAGLIRQPHTSAGRIPTDSGYRAYVDDMIASLDAELDDAQKRLVESLQRQASEIDGLIERTSAAVAELTDCLSVVVSPSILNIHVRQISLISLSNRQALLVVVLEDGEVINRSLSFDEDISSARLHKVEETLNRVFSGVVLEDVRLDAARATGDMLLMDIVDRLTECIAEGRTAKAHRMGLSGLLNKPEFSSSQALMPLMEVLEDDTVLMRIFDQTVDANDAYSVSIGSENVTETLAGVSVVAARYGQSESSGIIAVIGPTRMDYRKALDAVRMARQALRDH